MNIFIDFMNIFIDFMNIYIHSQCFLIFHYLRNWKMHEKTGFWGVFHEWKLFFLPPFLQIFADSLKFSLAVFYVQKLLFWHPLTIFVGFFVVLLHWLIIFDYWLNLIFTHLPVKFSMLWSGGRRGGSGPPTIFVKK